MKICKEILYKIFSLMLVVLLIANTVITIPITTEAATITKAEKSYDIAVVFDNSGSMYKNQGWCRAKYAMEIFASMLNYDKDKLHIFSMWEVTTDGTKPEARTEPKVDFQSIAVDSKEDIDKISNMFTVNAGGTPFQPIQEACEYLRTSTLDEKWLIVLTDGDFNEGDRCVPQSINLQDELSRLASDDIKVQYLGFGNAPSLKANEDKHFFAKKSTDISLKDDLISICNSIFQREQLPNARLSGKKLTLDLSMKNIIVFAQGANASIKSLKNESGEDVEITLNSGQRKYSEIKANAYENAPIDKSLAGQVVTFGACPAGIYSLEYSGAETIQVFYEPDVDIDVAIINSDGQKFDGSGELVAGEYTVISRIVDSVSGEDVTSHELMGDKVALRTFVKTSNDSEYKEYENGAEINFEPDSETEIYIEGEYLGKYKITSKDDPKLDWLNNIICIPKLVDFNVDANVIQSGNWYKLGSYEEWAPIRVELSVDGKQLTDEQLVASKLTIESTKPVSYQCEPIEGESAYNVILARDESGNYVEPEIGKYKLSFSATYIDEQGTELKDSDNVSFEIQRYSKFWRILIWFIFFALILVLWLTFMLQKVLPKNIRKDTASFTTISSGELDASFVDVEYRRKGKSLTISGSSAVEYDEQCSVTFDLRAVDNRFTKSNRRRVAIIGIDSSCEEMKIAGTPYVNFNGQWVRKNLLKAAEDGKAISPIDQELSCSPRFELSRKGGLSTLNCKTQTTK